MSQQQQKQHQSADVLLHDLPEVITQDMFHSYFLTRCSEHRIRKPNRWIMSLLEDFDTLPDNERERKLQDQRDREERRRNLDVSVALAADLGGRGDAADVEQDEGKAQKINDKNDDTAGAFEIEVEDSSVPRKAPFVVAKIADTTSNSNDSPSTDKARTILAERTELVVPQSVILGNTTLKILLEMMYFMPKLEFVDFSACRLYDTDPQRLAPSGNEILINLFTWAANHGAVSLIDIGRKNNPIGTEVGSAMLRAATQNPRLMAIEFDDRGIEQHVLSDLRRVLRINHAASPISTVIRSIRETSPPELAARMQSMREHGTMIIDRKSAGERQLLLTLLYDRPKLFLPLLESGEEQTAFVAPARQWLLSEVLHLARGLRGDGRHLFIVADGTVTVRVGRFDVQLRRGDIFGELIDGVMYQSGMFVRRSEHGSLFLVPHAVCTRSLFSVWDRRVARFLPIIKQCPMLSNTLPMYLQVRCCFDAQLVTIRGGNNDNSIASGGSPASPSKQEQRERRIVKYGDSFAGFFIVAQGTFRLRLHKHVARFMQGREEARQQKDSGVLDFDRGSLFGEEAVLNRRQTSTVNIDAITPAQVAAGATTTTATTSSRGSSPSPPNSAFMSRPDSSVVKAVASSSSALIAAATAAEASNNDATADNSHWQLLQLDAKFCSSVLIQAMKTVLMVQARTYGEEWRRDVVGDESGGAVAEQQQNAGEKQDQGEEE